MQEDIKKAIEKNLSAEVGTVLKERLEKAEKDAKELDRLKEENQDLVNRINDKDALLQKHKDLDERTLVVQKREDDVAEKEKKQEIEILKIQLEEANKRADAAKEFTSGLVRNSVFRKTIFDYNQEGGPGIVDGQGYHHPPTASSRNYDETKTEE